MFFLSGEVPSGFHLTKLPSSRWRLFRWRIESSISSLFSPFHLFFGNKERSASKTNTLYVCIILFCNLVRSSFCKDLVCLTRQGDNVPQLAGSLARKLRYSIANLILRYNLETSRDKTRSVSGKFPRFKQNTIGDIIIRRKYRNHNLALI